MNIKQFCNLLDDIYQTSQSHTQFRYEISYKVEQILTKNFNSFFCACLDLYHMRNKNITKKKEKRTFVQHPQTFYCELNFTE